MKTLKAGDSGSRSWVLVFDRGEKVAETLKRFASEQALEGAWIRGLGAVEDAELGWFDRDEKTYRTRTFEGPLELLSLQGNFARADGDRVWHLHAVCAGPDLKAVGGHLVEASCAVTLEMIVQETPFSLERAFDERFDLKLLSPAKRAD